MVFCYNRPSRIRHQRIFFILPIKINKYAVLGENTECTWWACLHDATDCKEVHLRITERDRDTGSCHLRTLPFPPCIRNGIHQLSLVITWSFVASVKSNRLWLWLCSQSQGCTCFPSLGGKEDNEAPADTGWHITETLLMNNLFKWACAC